MMETLFPGISHLQNIHPLVVHFPIAFLTGSVFFYLLALVSRKEALANTALALLITGALAAAAAVGTGLYAEPGVMVSHSVRERLLSVHKQLMIATLVLSMALALWATAKRPFPQKGRAIFFLLLIILMAVLSVGADYGARMVYDYNAGGNACSQPIDFTK